ncbi:MAG: hypothetical protein ACRDLA_16065 [Thermoleophilaceae bacterium]
MVSVELHENVLTEHGHGEWRVVASLEVEGADYDLRDPEHRLDMSLSVLSASESGRRLVFADQPEEWARSLPSAYHAPDMHAVVTHDDNPPARLEVERQTVRLTEAETSTPAAYA